MPVRKPTAKRDSIRVIADEELTKVAAGGDPDDPIPGRRGGGG